MTASTLTEGLANIDIAHVTAFTVGATIIRLSVVRFRNATARLTAEILESAIIVVVGIFLIVRPFLCQGFYIPSPSMEPTLIGKDGRGDHILVNKLEYRLAPPQRNDVVVFVAPPNAVDDPSEATPGEPVDFIKRLIGLPGERIQTIAGRVWVGEQPYGHAVIRDRLAAAGLLGSDAQDEDSQANHHVKFTRAGVTIDGNLITNAKLAEILTGDSSTPIRIVPGRTLINGATLDEPFIAEDPDYDMQLFHGEPLRLDSTTATLDGEPIMPDDYYVDKRRPPEAIPAGCYFMMGDNRNDSRDSTEWGVLTADRIIGRAQVVFWPFNRARIIR